MQEPFADLHTHTTASDGRLTPSELIQLARKRGVHTLGIADHDTFHGLREARQAAQDAGIELVPGIELSCQEGDRDIHLLGYYLDFDHPELEARLEFFRNERFHRAKKMVAKLQDLGIHISWERVLEIAGDAQSIGRPHVAQAILEKGYASSWDEIFEKWIGDHAPAYVPKAKMTPKEAIQLVLDFGGIPVIAHPALNADPDYVRHLVQYGLRGVEVLHSRHSEEDVQTYRQLAEELGLLMTGGSDFHGIREGDEHGDLGSVLVPLSWVEALKRAAHALQ